MGSPVVIAAATVCALLVGLQVAADRAGFQGPLHSLVSDYLATPKSATLPWAGLALAMVGLTAWHRLVALSIAAGLDVVLFAERVWRGGPLAVGNGPLIVLTGLAVLAWLRWSGVQRADALRSIGWGALLIVASKAGDTWLQISAVARPMVLDEYVMVADHAFAQPSWLMGRVIEMAGAIPYHVLHWVYIELPVAAIAVAVYQLRDVTARGWPRHHLVRTFLVLGLVGPLIYLLFPVVGPVFAFGTDWPGFQLSHYRPHALSFVDLAPRPVRFDGVTPRNCMPSMHTAWALAVCIHARACPPWMRWGGVCWLAGTVAATLGFGYHYGADLVAGAVLCLTVEAALRNPQLGWNPTRIRLVVTGTALLATLLLCFRFLAVPMARLPLLFGPLLVGGLVLYAVAFVARSRPASVKVVSRPASSVILAAPSARSTGQHT
ncbi:MAG TPA: DUF5933 domain-containing protein [Mycobacterium sp.]|nr:DUF5933 domain-containing protein [Mycobacterium sp.]